MNDRVDTHLQAQYEAYPYPERHPEDEKQRLLIGTPSHLREIDYWIFGARRPQSQFMRVLIAGCGTGDGAIMVAQQLARGRPGEVVCIDRSATALNIAKKRAEYRGLQNIRFIQASLTDLRALELGLFDYIDCCGVLHHLPDPHKTLKDLAQLLAPQGGIGLMVYAPYGRTGVYMVQDALMRLAPLEEAPPQRLEIAKRVMRHLPATAWLHQNGNFGDHLSGGDAGLYDLLLNPRDRSYTVEALYDLIENAGLVINHWMEPARYRPAFFMPDPRLRERIAKLDERQQAALAEELCANMATHIVYVQKQGEQTPKMDFMSETSVPIAREIPTDILAKHILPNGHFPCEFGTLTFTVPLPAQSKAILLLIDGTRTVGEIAQIAKERGIKDEKFFKIWPEMFEIFSALNKIVLRAPL